MFAVFSNERGAIFLNDGTERRFHRVDNGAVGGGVVGFPKKFRDLSGGDDVFFVFSSFLNESKK